MVTKKKKKNKEKKTLKKHTNPPPLKTNKQKTAELVIFEFNGIQ